MNASSKKLILIPTLVLLAGAAWWWAEFFKAPEYDWIEICTQEGIKKVKYDNEGNLLAEEWISRTPAHVLAEIEQANKAGAINKNVPDVFSEDPHPVLENIQIAQCWIRSLPNNLPAAGYFELKNNSQQELVLTGVTSKEYGSALLHENVMKQGMLAMEALPEVRIPLNGKLSFSPKTNHVMLENGNKSLKKGDFVEMTFYFQGIGVKSVQCKMNGPNALSY